MTRTEQLANIVSLTELAICLEQEQGRIVEALSVLRKGATKERETYQKRTGEITGLLAAITDKQAKQADELRGKFSSIDELFANQAQRSLVYDRDKEALEQYTKAKIAEIFAAQPKPRDGVDGKDASLINSFRGNWNSDLVLRRGDTFTFRGSFYLCTKDCKNKLPTVATQKTPNEFYAVLSISGAPGLPPVIGSNVIAAGPITTSGLTMNTARLLGRTTASSGAIEEITIGTGLTLSAGVLSVDSAADSITIGTTTIAPGGTSLTLAGLTNIALTNAATGIAFGSTTPGIISGTLGAITLTAAGTNQNVTAIPSGTGSVIVPLQTYGITPPFQGVTVVSSATDNAESGFLIDAYGNGLTNRMVGRMASGTPGSPGAVASGRTLLSVSGRAHDGTAFSGSAVSITMGTTEAWTTSAHGTSILFSATPKQSTTGRNALGLFSSDRMVTIGQPSQNFTTPAWGTLGVQFSSFLSQTYTDSSSTTGTVATAVANSFAVPTFAASNTGVIFTNAANLYIAGDVTAGTNVTLTNSYGLWNVGKTRLDGNVGIGAGSNDNILLTLGSLVLASGTNLFGAYGATTVPSGVTGTFAQYYSNPSTAAAAFTVTTFAHFRAAGISSLGAGSAATTEEGFSATSGLTKGTAVYGFHGAVVASGTARWNLYMDGTAPSFIGATLRLGSTTGTSLIDSSGAFTITGGAGNMTITAGTGNSRTLTLQTTTSGGTATNALVLSATQNATFGGSITTSTPNGGTAGAWKLGIRVAATSVLDTTQYIQVDVGGTLFRLACAA